MQGRWALLLGALALAMAVAGCDGVATTPTSKTVAGLVLTEGTPQGTVSLRDSSSPPQERATLIGSGGSYSLDFSGLKPPFVVRADLRTPSGATQLYTIPGDEIATNLSELSTNAVAAVTRTQKPEESYEEQDHGGATYYRMYKVLAKLREVLKPLFDLYQVPEDPFGDDGMDSALKAMLRDITVSLHHGSVVVKNRATGGVIFEGPLTNLSSGTFYPENMPSGPGTSEPPSTDGAALYAASCAKCHGALPGDVGGATAAEIRSAIVHNEGGMAKLRKMTDAQLAAIAAALASNNPPTTCTSFTYTDWGTCQSNGTQTRTVTAAAPAGCSGGSPVLTQSCTYVPPTNTCTSFTYSAWGTCTNGTQTRTVTSASPTGCTGGSPVLSQSCTAPLDGAALYEAKCARCHQALASSDVLGASAATITAQHATKYSTEAETAAIAEALGSAPPANTCTSFTYSAWGTCQADGTQSRTVTSSSPAGCTGGSPVLTQSCTYVPPVTTCTSFTYSAWGTCQSNGSQSRTVTSSSPAGCTGGSPVLTQSCTYVPPVTTCTSFTYSAWGTCQSNGSQSRTVTSSSPAGCTGGSPVLTQSCTYVPPVTTCTSFTYSAWGTCTNGTQTRTVTSSSPAGCTGGNPVLSQSCTAPLDGAALYESNCARCHGSLASSDIRGVSASAITAKHGTKYSTAEQATAIANALK
jgi:mono/diheme cytochrome c family protein